MDPKIIVIISVSYLYGLFEVFMNLRQRSRRKVISARDRGKFVVVVWTHYPGLYPVIFHWRNENGPGLSMEYFFRERHGIDRHWIDGQSPFHPDLETVFFAYSVAKVDDQKIIESGMYKFIRHPGYLGQLMIFLGISISISNWLSVLAMMMTVTVGYLYRIQVEERFMLEEMGEQYLQYQALTKRIIPLIY